MKEYTLSTNCAGDCGKRLDLGPARSCAILICGDCRKDQEKFRIARSRLKKHLDEHIAEGRKSNPWYPFNDFNDAWQHA